MFAFSGAMEGYNHHHPPPVPHIVPYPPPPHAAHQDLPAHHGEARIICLSQLSGGTDGGAQVCVIGENLTREMRVLFGNTYAETVRKYFNRKCEGCKIKLFECKLKLDNSIIIINKAR